MKMLINGLIVLIVLNCCNNKQTLIADPDFLSHLDSYLTYIDSTNEYTNDFDFIYLEAAVHNDNVDFVITLSGGPYSFIKEEARIINFIKYKTYDIMFIGDFPNEIVNVHKNKSLNFTGEVVKRYYSNDYRKYKADTLNVVPLIYDYMAIYLTFKNGKLISQKRQYY